MGTESYTETTSGLLDEYTLQVESAWFGPDEENDDDRVFLFLVGPASVDGEVEDEEHRDRFSVGNGWEVVDDGAAVEHASGKNRFNRNSGVGRLITAIVEVLGDEVEKFAARGDSYEAKAYNGVTFEFKRVVVSKWKNDDGEMVEWALPLPTAVNLPAAKGRKASTAKKSSTAKTASRTTRRRTKKSLRDQLIEMAGEYEDFDAFVDAALEAHPEIEEDDELHAEVLDDGDDGIWAQGGDE